MLKYFQILLENILPAHVAEHYLHRSQGVPTSLSTSDNVRMLFNKKDVNCFQFGFNISEEY